MNTILLIIKTLISNIDIDYSDTDLTNLALIAAIYVQKDFNFDTTYSINLIEQTLSPEPDSDNDFCLVVSIKTAILIVQGELRDISNRSIKVTDGPSSLDLSTKLDKVKTYLDILKIDYDKMKLANSFGNSIGAAVISPTLNLNIYPDRFN